MPPIVAGPHAAGDHAKGLATDAFFWPARPRFVRAWIFYAVLLEWTRFGADGLNGRIDRYREAWFRRTLAREMRMVDTQIMMALQSGAAFFASTSLIAIGGALGLLRTTEQIIELISGLPFGAPTTREQWEAKTVGLAVILVYAFFKFSCWILERGATGL